MLGYFSSSLGLSQQIFSHAGMGLLGLNQHLTDDKCLAQENNTVPQVRPKPATPQSRVKHSTTKQLRPRLILMVYILIEMNSNAKKQCFIYFSSVSHEISVNLIKRCHYSRYTILTNRSTRVLPSTTIRRIPQLFCFNRFQLKIIKPRPEIKLGWCKLHIEIGN